MWFLRSLERAGVIQVVSILECKNGLVLSNTHIPVSGTWSLLFPKKLLPQTGWKSNFLSTFMVKTNFSVFFSVFYCFDLYDVILASQANCWCLFYFSFTQSMGLEQPHPLARYVAKTAWLEKCKLCLLIFFLCCCCCCYFTEYFKSSHWISLSTSKYLENI